MPSSRTRLLALTCALAAALSLTGVTPATAAPAPALTGLHLGLDRLLADGTPDGRAIVTFDTVPTIGQTHALEALGLTVQPMKRLPLALVEGPVAAMVEAVSSGIGLDVYPDDKLELLDTPSSNAMSSTPAAAKWLRKQGFTGKGVTVGVVDSGCDATHADLADHVVHNITLASPEYANAGTQPTLVVPVDQGPLSNTDLGSGHGTHVAGIIGADSTSAADGSRLGVAPDAAIACFSIGLVLFTTAVVTAYDYMLQQPDLMGIDVVNNSWGNSYRQFDPNDPVAVATKAVVAKGVTVVFAAGNSGSGAVPMSLNPFSQSPWVISVAAGTVNRFRGDFSSNGLVNDNSLPTDIGADDHTTYTGDRIGLVHPDITAPGVDISSTCDSAGTLIGPCAPNDNATASGTSMASPHIAGAAAVLLQAQPPADARPGPARPSGHRDARQGGRRQDVAALLGGRLRLRQPGQGRRPGARRELGAGPAYGGGEGRPAGPGRGSHEGRPLRLLRPHRAPRHRGRHRQRVVRRAGPEADPDALRQPGLPVGRDRRREPLQLHRRGPRSLRSRHRHEHERPGRRVGHGPGHGAAAGIGTGRHLLVPRDR